MTKEVAVKEGTIVGRREKPVPAHITSPAPLPAELDGLFELRAWFDALTRKTEYTELNPDYMAERMLYLTLMSGSIDELLTPKSITGLQDLVLDRPGETTGNITVTDLYVAKSDQADGNPCYMLFSYVQEETMTEVTTTTGATQIQATFLTYLALGHWPIRCRITRGDRQDRGGRYMFLISPWE